jgi:hypothetical protein
MPMLDYGKYAAPRGLTEAKAIERGLKEKSRELVEQGADIYAKT